MTRAADGLHPLDETVRPALRAFTCRNYDEPWSDVVQAMIRDDLADALGVGVVHGVGLWRDGRLVALAAWRLRDAVCHCSLVAVANGHRRRGHGRRVKAAVIAAARRAGAVAVVSMVDWGNDPMIELNVALGANVEAVPGDRDYCRCTIPLPQSG